MNYFKRSFVLLISFIFIFGSQSNVWASDVKKYTIDKNTFNYTETEYQQISENNSFDDYKAYLWLVSFLIPGLGQVLMGDLWGLKFPVIMLSITGLAYYVASDASKGDLDGFGSGFFIYFIIIPSAILLLAVVYIWNMMDAAFMSKEISLRNEYRKLKETPGKTEDFIYLENTLKKIKVSDKGNITFNLYNFY